MPTVTLDHLLKSDLGKQILVGLRAEQLEERKRLVADLERVDRQEREQIPPLDEAFKAAAEQRTEAQQQLAAAVATEAQARHQLFRVIDSGRRARERIDGRLAELMPDCVRDFMGWVDAETNTARRPGGFQAAQGADLAALQTRYTKSARARLAALAECHKAAQAMRRSPLAETELEAQIAKLKAAVPALER